MSDGDLAAQYGVVTRHERMPNGELRFRLVGPDGTSYIRTHAGEQGAWQNGHYHERVRETYIVERGWMVLAVLDEASKSLVLHLLKPGDVFTSPVGAHHNVYLAAKSVIHTVKHSASRGDPDWHASEVMDRLTREIPEMDLLHMANQ